MFVRTSPQTDATRASSVANMSATSVHTPRRASLPPVNRLKNSRMIRPGACQNRLNTSIAARFASHRPRRCTIERQITFQTGIGGLGSS